MSHRTEASVFLLLSHLLAAGRQHAWLAPVSSQESWIDDDIERSLWSRIYDPLVEFARHGSDCAPESVTSWALPALEQILEAGSDPDNVASTFLLHLTIFKILHLSVVREAGPQQSPATDISLAFLNSITDKLWKVSSFLPKDPKADLHLQPVPRDPFTFCHWPLPQAADQTP
jgi:hypothetical protein